MKSWKSLNVVALGVLVACSTTPTKTTKVTFQETFKYEAGSRTIAGIDTVKVSSEKVKKTVKGVFHSYILGQVLLHDFDAALDKDAANAMNTDAYNELLSIRVMVDEFEENINEMYIKLVMISALPDYSEDQKAKARDSLNVIGQFMDGITTDQKELPENLKTLVLANLREKQTHLYDELMAIKEDASITKNDPQVISVIYDNMVLLRGTRMKFFKDLKAYKVDQVLLDEAVAEMKKDDDFKNFKSDVKKMSKEMKKLTKEMQKGRSTSSDSIYPNSSSAGNVTGRSFPANTWSITYDDGPGGKTTPTVLKNLKDRGLKATFFMLAKQVEGLPTTAKSVVDAEMNIACHSYDHAQLTKVGPVALEKQIGGAKKIIETKLGKTIKLFRLPYGAGVSVASIRAKIAEHNMIHVFWNVDTLDWQDKNPQSIVNRAVKQMAGSPKNAGVILFHDIHPQSVIASALLMDHMKKEKITECTVQGVIDQINQGLPSCQ